MLSCSHSGESISGEQQAHGLSAKQLSPSEDDAELDEGISELCTEIGALGVLTLTDGFVTYVPLVGIDNIWSSLTPSRDLHLIVLVVLN